MVDTGGMAYVLDPACELSDATAPVYQYMPPLNQRCVQGLLTSC